VVSKSNCYTRQRASRGDAPSSISVPTECAGGPARFLARLARKVIVVTVIPVTVTRHHDDHDGHKKSKPVSVLQRLSKPFKHQARNYFTAT
jgi:hypothetical protein